MSGAGALATSGFVLLCLALVLMPVYAVGVKPAVRALAWVALLGGAACLAVAPWLAVIA